MRIGFVLGVPRAALATISLVVLAGCATGGGGGLLPTGQELTPAAEHVLNHAPRVAPVSRELSKTVPPSYILEPGDTVLVEPVRFDSPLRFAADQVIQPDGTIDLGRYGRLVVAGCRIEEVEARIEAIVNADPVIVEALEEADLTCEEVNVRLIDPAGSVFYVLGAVNSPGAYPYTGRETVLDAVLAAGGLADNARKCEILLARPSPVGDCRTALPVCWDHIVQLGDTTTNYQLMPGDRVFVPANGCFDMVCSFFKCKDDCPRCCYPQCPCGYASVKCPYPTTYDLACPPYATPSAGRALVPEPAEADAGPQVPAPTVPPAPATEDAPDAFEREFSPEPAP